MVTMPSPPATDPHPDETRSRVPQPAGLLAAGSLGGAAIALVGIGLIGRQLGASAFVWMMFLNAAVVLLGAGGAVIPATRTAALLLTWNGLGVSLSLLALGLLSVGALIALPVILIALGLSAWPRNDGESLVSGPAMVALVGGLLFLPAAYGLIAALGLLAGVAG
jgi:hypothetical protein